MKARNFFFPCLMAGLVALGLCCRSRSDGKRTEKRGSLIDYAKRLGEASRPGPTILKIVDRDDKADRFVKLAALVKTAFKLWTYRRDEGEDDFRIAEREASAGRFEGDCEDLGALIIAFCRSLDIACFLGLGTSLDQKSGHAWVEVAVSETSLHSPQSRRRLCRLFEPVARIVEHDGELWLQLAPRPERLNGYRLTHVISHRGELKEAGFTTPLPWGCHHQQPI